MQQLKRKPRNSRGVSIIILVIALAIVQLTIDFFVFNLIRILMVQRQIDGVCESASLAGTSILAGFDIADDNNSHAKLIMAQKAASRCAENMIMRGRILGQVIDKAIDAGELSELDKNLKADSCQYVVTLADPSANYAAVNIGDANGRTISCYMSYGYKPIFLGFLGNFCYTITGNCVSGLPQIDTVIALDLSASMDDQTVVTFVRREWIHSNLGSGNFAAGNVDANSPSCFGCGIIQYVSLNCPSTPHTLANYIGWDYNIAADSGDENTAVLDGSPTNVLPPQNLETACYEPHGAVRHPMNFDAYLRSHYACYTQAVNYSPWEASISPYCRALDFATPPGNCDLSVGMGGNGDAETDLAGNSAIGSHGIGSVVPQINAFTDTTWHNDGSIYFGYQPAAPGCINGPMLNDPIPSPDQQTFTDLVVNIADPRGSNSSSKLSYEQPLVGPDYFTGFSYTFPHDEPDLLLRDQTFNFPNIAVVVEAARGNLESTSALPSGLKNTNLALIDRPVSIDGTIFNMAQIEPRDGYQRAYQRLAMMFTQPLATVLASIDQSYLQKLHKLTDCRFGFVSFSSKGSLEANGKNHLNTFGTLNDSSINPRNSRSFYIFGAPYGNPKFSNPVYDSGSPTNAGVNNAIIQDGSGSGFRMPRVCLNVNLEHYPECASRNKIPGDKINDRLNADIGRNGIYNCRVQSITDTGEALTTANSMFHCGDYDLANANKCRRQAYKTIILFTDGEPTAGIEGEEGKHMLSIAEKCQSDGIAIFAISLNLAKEKAFNKLKEHQLALLDDKRPQESNKGGIVWRAGHGGRYYPCENLNELKLAVNDLARRFSQSQR